MDECLAINIYTLCAVLNIHWRHGDNVPYMSVHYSTVLQATVTQPIKSFYIPESNCDGDVECVMRIF